MFTVCNRDSFRALDALLGQMTSNMDDVTNLRRGLEDRLNKHVDVREALTKKKDEQLQGRGISPNVCTRVDEVSCTAQ